MEAGAGGGGVGVRGGLISGENVLPVYYFCWQMHGCACICIYCFRGEVDSHEGFNVGFYGTDYFILKFSQLRYTISQNIMEICVSIPATTTFCCTLILITEVNLIQIKIKIN